MSFLFAENARPALVKLANPATLAVIPVGSTEQHAEHLPVNTDALLTERVVAGAAAKAAAKQLPVLVTPTLAFGFSRYHLVFGGTLSLSQDTLVRVLKDLAFSLLEQGYRRLLFVNGHGGNAPALALTIADLATDQRGCLFASCNYWDLAKEALMRERESPLGGMGHACEFETSLYLFFDGGRVDRGAFKTSLPQPRLPGESLDLLQKGPLSLGMRWEDVTRTGAIGDPTLASREKGERWAGLLTDALAENMENLLKAELPPRG